MLHSQTIGLVFHVIKLTHSRTPLLLDGASGVSLRPPPSRLVPSPLATLPPASLALTPGEGRTGKAGTRLGARVLGVCMVAEGGRGKNVEDQRLSPAKKS